ncbi:MAG TPA: shikimate kinase [Pyrinomonadaceae bacterium]|jgi:shikimate kinase
MNEPARRIVITGFMGAGKSTVAAALAERLGCAMLDLDRLVEEREGRSAEQLIDEDGEGRFRRAETSALRHALNASTARIIALGGGAWTIEGNRLLIEQHDAFTVWLDAPFELCWERIAGGENQRPLGRERASARELYERRRAHYDRAILHLKVDKNSSPAALAAEITAALPQQSGEKR